jgi:hypothetical protein
MDTLVRLSWAESAKTESDLGSQPRLPYRRRPTFAIRPKRPILGEPSEFRRGQNVPTQEPTFTAGTGNGWHTGPE